MLRRNRRLFKKFVWLVVVTAIGVTSAITTSITFAQSSGTSPDQAAAINCPTGTFLDVSKYEGAGETYPKPELNVSCNGDMMTVTSNSIPQYKFVQVTPTPLVAQTTSFEIPLNPQLAAHTTAAPLAGPLGIAVNGIPIWGPSEAPVSNTVAGGDPIAASMMDRCMGHTANVYHYHALLLKCLADGVQDGQASPILGYALDGFPIYGPYGCKDTACSQVVLFKSSWDLVGNARTDVWHSYQYSKKDGAEYLDQCNGRIGPDGTYRYYATFSFPYTIGCYAGTPNRIGSMGRGDNGQGGQTLDNQPNNQPGNQGQVQGGPNGQGGPQGNQQGNLPGGQGQFAPAGSPQGGSQGNQQGNLPGGQGGSNGRMRPNFASAAQQLGITEQQLMDALGPPPPDFAAAAQKLGITEQQLMEALGIPTRPGNGQGGPNNQGGSGGPQENQQSDQQGGQLQTQPPQPMIGQGSNQGSQGGPANGCSLTAQGEVVCK